MSHLSQYNFDKSFEGCLEVMDQQKVNLELKKDVIAHIGIVGKQEVFKEVLDKTYSGNIPIELANNGLKIEKLTERRKGGLVQIVIPCLKNKKLNKTENEYGKVTHFAPL